jgi:hypothetical protein
VCCNEVEKCDEGLGVVQVVVGRCCFDNASQKKGWCKEIDKGELAPWTCGWEIYILIDGGSFQWVYRGLRVVLQKFHVNGVRQRRPTASDPGSTLASDLRCGGPVLTRP